MSVAEARVDPRAYLSGTWLGNVTTMERRHGGLTLREPGTDARCRLVLDDDGLTSVPGRCRVNGVDVTLSLQPASQGETYVLAATSDHAACAVTISGQVTRR